VTANLGKAVDKPLFALRYLRGKIKATMGYHLGNGYSFSPGRALITLTGRCNLRCQMCPQERHASFRQDIVEERDADISELRKMIDEIRRFRPMVLVSGGELFLHPSWHEFLSYVKINGLFCSIGTNGTLLGKYASELVEIGVDELSVSIDGPERIHDEIRGVPGAYAKAVDGIKQINEAKERARTYKPLINVIFTISPLNHRHIAAVAASMGSLKVDTFRIGHLNFLRPKDLMDHRDLFAKLFGIDRDASWAGYVWDVSGIDGKLVAGTIEGLKKRPYGPPRITVFPDFKKNEIITYYAEGPFRSKSFPNACLAPWDIAIIGPKGEVLLCPNYIVGNLRDQGFRDIWNNDKARHFRKVMKKRKQLPACSRGCCFFYI
jgi:radical SAM protein with 4Fe4S-binding SPASM domain